jgi:hypothetical protein
VSEETKSEIRPDGHEVNDGLVKPRMDDIFLFADCYNGTRSFQKGKFLLPNKCLFSVEYEKKIQCIRESLSYSFGLVATVREPWTREIFYGCTS